MNDIGEAVGTGVTGTLLSAAVEGQGAAKEDHFAEQRCLNCETELVGPHCHVCGQRAHLHRTVRGFLHDLIHGVLHFEGKFWRTLPMLAWHPGRLTRRYIDGERAKFVGPIAVFLFVVFASFAAFQMAGGSSAMLDGVDNSIDAVEEVEREYLRRSQELEDKRAQLSILKQDGSGELRTEVEQLERELTGLGGALQQMGSDLAPDTIDSSQVDISVNQSGSWQSLKENPQLLAYKMQTNAYKFAWLLIPLSAPFVWLLYCWRRRFKMYDHVVFTTYSIAFMLALAGLSAWLIYIGETVHDGIQMLGVITMLYAPVHMYRHVRGTYGSSRLGSVLRTFALSGFAWIAIGLFAIVLAKIA